MQSRRAAWGGMIVVVLMGTGSPAPGQTTTERVSVSASGAEAIGGRHAPRPSVSGDGTTVAFESPVATLVPGDTNSVSDIFIATGGVVTRVTGLGGAQTTCGSQRASVSSDGRFVSFDSCSNNLVAGDTNNVSDVFLLDRNTGIVSRVSVSSAEAQAVGGPSFSSAVSPNGQYVAFLSSAISLDGGSGATHVFLRDLTNGTTHLVSKTPGGGLLPSDGRPGVDNAGTVAFVTATNVTSIGDNNGTSDVYLRIGATGSAPSTVRVSLSATGAQLTAPSTRPSISADGQLVTFETAAAAVTGDTNTLTDIYVRDIAAATTVLVSRTAAGAAGNGNSTEASISPSGWSSPSRRRPPISTACSTRRSTSSAPPSPARLRRSR